MLRQPFLCTKLLLTISDLLRKWGLNSWKHMLVPNWLSTKSRGIWSLTIEIWHHITKQLSSQPGDLKLYISIMCHVLRTHVDALAVLSSHDLCYLRFTLKINEAYEDYLEVNEVHDTSTCMEIRDWCSCLSIILHDILLDDPKEATSIWWRASRFYITRWQRCYNVAYMMDIASLSFTKRGTGSKKKRSLL